MSSSPIDLGIRIVGAGLMSPAGSTRKASGLTVRAKVSAFREHPTMIDRHGESFVVSSVESISPEKSFEERLTALAVESAREALSVLGDTAPLRDFALRIYVALPKEGFTDRDKTSAFAATLASSIGFPKAIVEPIFEEHAAGIQAIKAAVDRIRSSPSKLCLVGGVDSLIDPRRLSAFDARGQLHSANHSWGFMPSEAGAFLLLAESAFASARGWPALATIAGVAVVDESNVMDADGVCIGEGLTAAFRGALTGAARVDQTWCDLNGEPYRADEFGFTMTRTNDRFVDGANFHAPSECWGDIGCATAPALVGLATAASEGRYLAGKNHFVWCSSGRSPLRGAVLLEMASSERGRV